MYKRSTGNQHALVPARSSERKSEKEIAEINELKLTFTQTNPFTP